MCHRNSCGGKRTVGCTLPPVRVPRASGLRGLGRAVPVQVRRPVRARVAVPVVERHGVRALALVREALDACAVASIQFTALDRRQSISWKAGDQKGETLNIQGFRCCTCLNQMLHQQNWVDGLGRLSEKFSELLFQLRGRLVPALARAADG